MTVKLGSNKFIVRATYNGEEVVSEVYDYTCEAIMIDSIVYGYEGSVIGYEGEISVVTVLGTVDGIVITKIEQSAFEGCATLTSIDLPDTIVTIGKAAFKNCSNLASMN